MATVLAQQTRNPPSASPDQGLLLSAAIDVSTLPPETAYSATALLPAASLLDSTLAVTMRLEGGPSATGPWALMAETTWTGQPGRNGQGAPPSLTYSTSSPLPAFVRGGLWWSKRVSIGMDVSTS